MDAEELTRESRGPGPAEWVDAALHWDRALGECASDEFRCESFLNPAPVLERKRRRSRVGPERDHFATVDPVLKHGVGVGLLGWFQALDRLDRRGPGGQAGSVLHPALQLSLGEHSGITACARSGPAERAGGYPRAVAKPVAAEAKHLGNGLEAHSGDISTRREMADRCASGGVAHRSPAEQRK